MISKIDNAQKSGNSHIAILYPGTTTQTTDTGLGTIGRIDQANIPPGVTIKMHPHVNDEILSYFRSGKVQHTDSAGFTEFITPTKLMLMKAGKAFYHEEKMLNTGENMEGLQIFIRPAEKDAVPSVSFRDLAALHSENTWRLLAAPTADAGLQFTSQTWVYDFKAATTEAFGPPAYPKPNLMALLYVFRGSILGNGGLSVQKGESLVIKDESPFFRSDDAAELVLFLTDESSVFYDGGMFSGNKRQQMSSR
ncbi:MAG: pirin family protein [Cytophagales bacterium]|jgi:hypothetical protein|nr:pirin family protein [Cytophagales bacterium]